MKEQIQKAALDMMNKVKIDRYHRYTDVDGKFLAGGSTIAGVMPKSETQFLAPWGGKEAVKALGYYDEIENEDHAVDIKRAEEILEIIKGCDVKTYLNLLKESKGGAKKKGAKALNIGKTAHEWLERYVKAKIRGTDLPDLKEWDEYPFIQNSFKEFFKWEAAEVKEWYLSEARVCRLDNPLATQWDTPTELKGYAGTLDALALTNRGLTLIDFKFAGRISPEYFIQAALYGKTFEPYKIDVPERAIIRFPKEEFLLEWDKDIHKYKKVKNEFEVQWGNPKLLDWDFHTGLHQREIIRYFNAIKNG